MGSFWILSGVIDLCWFSGGSLGVLMGFFDGSLQGLWGFFLGYFGRILNMGFLVIFWLKVALKFIF